MKISQNRQRQKKLKAMRQKYQAAKTITEKEKILAKLDKIAPWLSEKELLAKVETEKETDK
ncbi:DUF6800 family protein [Patescibacteria group bacterium]